MSPHCSKFVRGIADPFVVSQGDPPLLTDVSEPSLVGTILREEGIVLLHEQTRRREDPRKTPAQIAIREEDCLQAARSYSTASSISMGAIP